MMNRLDIGEMVRFIVVGVLATAIHYGFYYILLGATGHNIAYTIGYIVSFTVNFILSSVFTFGVSLSLQRLGRFGISHLLNYLIGVGLLNVMIWLGVPAQWAPLPVFLLVIPINFLLVRFAMKHEPKQGDGYKLFLLLVGLAMTWICLLDAPTLSDDMVYRFMFQEDMSGAIRPISSIGDLIHSQCAHYVTVNGRFLVHLVAQIIIVAVPSWIWQSLNGLLFVLVIVLSVRWISKSTHQMFFGAMMCLLLIVVIKDVRTTLFWGLGAFNYLWVLVVTLALMLYLNHLNGQQLSWRHVLLSPIAWVVGFSHEGLSLPISAAILVYLWEHRKTLKHDARLPYMLFYMLGTLCILLSPALWERASGDMTLMNRLISGAINIFFNIRIGWLLLLALIVAWYRNRNLVKEEFCNHRYVYVSLMVSLFIVILCGTNLDRVPFFFDFIALLLLLSLLSKGISLIWHRRLIIFACVVLILLYVPIVLARKNNYHVWQQIEQQMSVPDKQLIAVPECENKKNVFLDFFDSRYVNPSVEFGFFSVYQAFDANDLNMRCAATLFGKEKMTFLPADVLERIENDSTAYVSYELDKSGELYVWRMKDRQSVKRLTFVLNEEDLSTLWPHQRLTAYRGDHYDLDDLHYELVEVNGQPYLVFTRPTTNISRRINHIEYD